GMRAGGVPEGGGRGLYGRLGGTWGVEVRWWDTYLPPDRIDHRDFPATTPHHSFLFGFYHPEMQEVLLSAATQAGAEVRWGASVREVKPGGVPSVVLEHEGRVEEAHARLVVGADGRTSLVRQWAGFSVQHDPAWRMFAGVLLDKSPLAPDAWHEVLDPDRGQVVFLCPVGRGRVRAYFGYPQDAHRRFQGAADLPRLVEASLSTGAAPEIYAAAQAIGPLATFEADNTWVEHPYRAGVALIGDAAATTDPTIGQGMSLTSRDARVLRDHLLSHDDWDAA